VALATFGWGVAAGGLSLPPGHIALRDWTGWAGFGTIAGYDGILCGSSAIYLAMAELLEETRGKKILPY